jgi:hypothetical protein
MADRRTKLLIVRGDAACAVAVLAAGKALDLPLLLWSAIAVMLAFLLALELYYA